MPILECFTIPFGPPAQPGGPLNLLPSPSLQLAANGPTVIAEVGFDPALFSGGTVPTPPVPVLPEGAALQTIPTPAPQAISQVLALIDTGASHSCIDDDLACQLNLPLVDRIPIGGVGGSHFLCVYLGRLVIPQLNFSKAGPFTGAKMAQGGQLHRALIGRDFLASMMLVYDGTSGRVKLAT